MKRNKLLEQQLKELLPDKLREDPSLQPFLQAVNDAYTTNEQAGQSPSAILTSKAEERLSSLVHNFQAGILLDENGRVIIVNQTFCNLLGIPGSPEALTGMDCTTLAGQSRHLFKEPDQFVSRMQELLTERKIVANEELELADGRVLERDCIPIFTDGQYKGHLWKYCDITNRKKEEAELRANKELWQFALEGAGDGVWEYNFDTGEIYFSKQYKKMLGYEDDEFPNEVIEWSDRIYAYDLPLIQQVDKEYTEGRITSHQVEYRIRHKDGHYIWVLDRGKLISHTPEGKPGRLIGTHTDITHRKEIEEELKRLSVVASANENGVLLSDAEGKIFWTNKGFSKITGYTEEEILGKTPIELCKGPLSDRDTINRILDAFITGRSFSTEIIYYRKDGSWFWGRTRGQPIPGDKSKGQQYFGIIEDITQEKKQEEEMQRLSMIASSSTAGIAIFDRNDQLTWCNTAFEQITGFSFDELKGTNILGLVFGPLTDPETINRMKESAEKGEDFAEEFVHYRKDRSVFWAFVKMQFIRDKTGRIIQQYAVVRDITREREAQRELAEFQDRFRRTLEIVGDNVWEYNFITKEAYSSNLPALLDDSPPAGADTFGFWTQHIHTDDKRFIQELDAGYRSGKMDHHELEYRLVQKDGTIRWILDRGVIIEKDAQGNPVKIVGTHSDITKTKLADEALRINEEKYRRIITNMNLGMLEVDEEGIIQFANRGFCKMSGYEMSEIIGKNITGFVLFSPEKNHDLLEKKTSLRKKGVSDAYEIEVTNKQGEPKWWLVSAAPRYNATGEIAGSIGIHLDITAQKKLQQELSIAREVAENSARAKETFLANMSHEIRTPMNAILGMGHQLSKTKLNEQQHLFLDTINTAAEHLLILINDILDISKVEAGKLSLEHIGFQPQEIMQHCTRVMQHRAEEKGLQLLLEADNTTASVLIGDPYRLNQVLLNLVGNAIKFTDKGSVTLGCKLLETTADHQTLRFSVKDTGIGMDEEFMELIFQKFTQKDETVARKYGGTGLGMSITKELVELMNGTIEIKSLKGAGTEIILTIPFAIGSSTDLQPTRKDKSEGTILKDKKILLVEDNEMNRLLATTILTNYGTIVEEARNGREAVNALQTGTYDLVLMDMQMPVMDGLEATSLIRATGNDIPIIALTANAIKGESERCKAAGMNDYISKPFQEEELIASMAHWIEQKTTTPDKENNMENTGSALYDLSKLYQISNDPGFISQMIDLFTEETPSSVREISAAMEKDDVVTVKAIVHRIKPSVDSMGMTQAYREIRSIETTNDREALKQHVRKLEELLDRGISQLKADHPAT